MEHLTQGWALEAWAGVYHFEPISEADAESRLDQRETVYVVETIGWPADEAGQPRLNQYFVFGLPAAIGMAAKLLGDLQESPEDIVAIRAATQPEEELFLSVVDHFNEQMPPALSDDEARALRKGSE